VRLPPGAESVIRRLTDAGYEGYLVGGSVRDLLLGRSGGDLDFTTNARPEELQRLFRGSHYPNRFGTVLVRSGGAQHEVTTYRGEGRYSDHRHPDEIAFVDRLEDDLQRRDFTINAMAMDAEGAIVDPFGGQEDLRLGLIRAVGDPSERLAEDPLRMMRAARLATQLSFTIEPRTWNAIAANAGLLAMISRERVRDELLKILASDHAVTGIDFLDHLGLLDDALPNLAAMRRMNRPAGEPDGAYQHALLTLRSCKGGALLRMAALLYGLYPSSPAGDLTPGPFPTREGGMVGEKGEAPATSTNDSRSATSSPLELELAGLHLSNADAAYVRGLIAGLPSVPPELPADGRSARRLLNLHGERLFDLLDLVAAHRLASTTHPDLGNLEQLRALRRLAERTLAEGQPRTIDDLAVNGADLMRELGIPPGPEVGRLLRALLERVLDDPALNERERLLTLARTL
jgi:hypothetical protein